MNRQVLVLLAVHVVNEHPDSRDGMASHSGRLTVRLVSYAGPLVAMGTMGYKHESMAGNGERTTAMLAKT